MQRKFRNLLIETTILTVVEVLLVGAFACIYLLQWWDLYKYIKLEYILYGVFILLFIDCLFVWLQVTRIYSLKKASDIKTISVIGNDVQEAYKFGQIGYLIVDENGNIIWLSDYLRDLSLDILNENIYKRKPELDDFNKKDVNKVTIKIDKRSFDIKFLKSANLFIFKEVTAYEDLYNNTIDDATCVGIINIDNYNDIISASETDTENIVRIRQLINEYAKTYKIVLREIRTDSYLALCSYQHLRDIIKDNFSLLDSARNIIFRESTRATLSIGFAYGFELDINKLNELASNALEIAMSRGGDQAVVSNGGSELEYFGGKTEAIESTSKVKIRVFANSLISLIKRSSNVLIMGHKGTDMDALGSCLGVKALCEYCKVESRVVYDQKISEKKTRSAAVSKIADYNEVFVDTREAVERLGPKSLIVVCDTSVPNNTVCPTLLDKSEKVVVIDHHRRGEKFIEKPVLSMIDPSASSASELVVEMIKYNSEGKIPLRKDYATIILSGIFLDTGFYKTKTVGMRTFEASMILKDYGADNGAASDLLKDEEEEFLTISKFIERKKSPFYGVSYCLGEDNVIYEQAQLAKVGNQCMQLRGNNAVFVLGRISDKEIGVSARSDGSINVQVICEKLDSGGGHLSLAGGKFYNITIAQAEQKLLDILDKNLTSARNTKGENEE